MKNKNINELTVNEYHGYFGDCLAAEVRKAFNNTKEALLHITFQPDVLTLSYEEVISQTKELFGAVKYIEVVEQTFKTSNRYNDGDYINGYHSHLIMKESDYITIEAQLKNKDIKDKRVWDLSGLMKYLRKQAGFTYTRILPMQHIPVPTINVPIERIPVDVKPKAIKKLFIAIRTLARRKMVFIRRTIIEPLINLIKKPLYHNDS